MKNITFLCGLLFIMLFTQNLIGQDEISIPWKFNDDIPGQFDGITKDSEGLHGYLGDQIFTSTDNGDHWYFCEKNPVLSKYFLLNKDSLAMFYTEKIISYTTG